MRNWIVPAFAAIGGVMASFFAHKRTALQVYENNQAAKLRFSRAVRMHTSRVYPWPWHLHKWLHWHQVHSDCDCPFKIYSAGRKRIPLLEHWAQRTMKPQNIEFSFPRMSLMDLTNFSLGFDIQFRIVELQQALQYGKIDDEHQLPEAFKRLAKSVFQERLLSLTYEDILKVGEICSEVTLQIKEWGGQFGLEVDWVRVTDITASVQTEDILLAPVRLERVQEAIRNTPINIHDPAALALLARFSSVAAHLPDAETEVIESLEEAAVSGNAKVMTLPVPAQPSG